MPELNTLPIAQASLGFWIGLAIAIIIVGIPLFTFLVMPLSLWWQSILSKAPVGLVQIVLMRFRKVNPDIIVRNRITAMKAGLDISADSLEAHYLAEGRVDRVVAALIAASKANIDLSFDRACAIDLAGRDVLDAVSTR